MNKDKEMEMIESAVNVFRICNTYDNCISCPFCRPVEDEEDIDTCCWLEYIGRPHKGKDMLNYVLDRELDKRMRKYKENINRLNDVKK